MERLMKPCKFTFDDTPAFDGFAHGSIWNGFDNVAVTPAVRDEIVAYFKKEYGDQYQEAVGDSLESVEIGDDGLFSLGWGFSTQIVPNIEAITDADMAASVAMNDLDEACRHLQDIAGITDGGVAGVCFSDINFDWSSANSVDREVKIRNWLRTEKDYR